MSNVAKAIKSDMSNIAAQIQMQAARQSAILMAYAHSPYLACPVCAGLGRVRSDHYLQKEEPSEAPERKCFACDGKGRKETQC